MTTHAANPTRVSRLVLLLVAVVTLLTTMLSGPAAIAHASTRTASGTGAATADTASAPNRPTAETRVGASTPVPATFVGVTAHITAGQRRDGPRSQPQIVSGHCVAAEDADDLVPQADKSFQFGGAGRSGAGVKNLVGPPNAVVRGASAGRVFVTDNQGRVILDITRDRVKPVVPGQGFLAGDGRKLMPTQQQLSWIEQLWGG